MLDEQLAIICQTVAKALIPVSGGDTPHVKRVEEIFKFWVDLIEKRATIPEGEEFVNTGIDIPKQFWNLDSKAQTEWLTEWGKPLPVVNKAGRKEWFVHVRNKDLQKLKKVFDDRQNNFDDMVQTKEKI